jgi:hypothetical protein
MKENIKKAWVKALRSGEYKQGKNFLCMTDEGVDRYCCLGVLADECLDGEWREFPENAGDRTKLIWFYNDGRGVESSQFFNKILTSDLDIKEENWMDILSDMNDSGKTFNEIADWIEKNL